MRKPMGKERRKRIFFAKGMCLVMVLLMSLLLLYNYAIGAIRQSNNDAIDNLKTENFNVIYRYILELQRDAYESARDVSVNLEEYMRSMDMDDLEYQLETGEISDSLDTTFHEYTSDIVFNGVDNTRNKFVIATMRGIIFDSNYIRAEGRTSRSWESEIQSSYNSVLEEEAIDRLLNRTDKLIITESVNTLRKDYGEHIKISTATYDSLLEVYLDEGIEGFGNYQILCPAYITNNGDIFGQKDIVNGIKVGNNKIIVIQEFNLYDQIVENRPDLLDDSEIVDLQIEYSNSISLLYIIGLFFIGFMIVMLIYFSNSYNNYIDKYNLEKDEDDEE